MTRRRDCARCHGTGIEPGIGGGKRCEYVKCKEPAAGVMREGMGLDAALLCDLHLRPDMHPPDLRHLLVRWPA